MVRARKPGGLRVGEPATAYPNRTDLSQQKNLPARVATGQTYGLAGQQLAAQHNVPMAPQPLGVAGAPAPGGPVPGVAAPPSQGPPPAPPIAPGAFGPLARPTERPGEPVTTGLPIGAGPGPEAMPPGPAGGPAPDGKMSDMLNRIALQTGSSTIAAIAARAQAMGT